MVTAIGFSLLFKTFRPHYESVLYEACLEAKKLDINEVSVLELGVEELSKRTDLEEETIEEIVKILNSEYSMRG